MNVNGCLIAYEFFKESEEYVLNIILNESVIFDANKSDLIHESHQDGVYMYTFKSKNLEYLNKIKDSLDKGNLISYSIDR